ncbi:MAG: FHA domain-containing protein [Clostridia bacterium]|nr:FHA domain-containing protein [Clostridia bacterium]
MDDMMSLLRYIIPAIVIIVVSYCIKHLLSSKAPKVNPACLIDETTGKEYLITNWETSIGRSNACDIVLDYAAVSRFHAVISKHKKGWVVTDTNSSGGTYVNRKKAKEPLIVNDGDCISFGGIELQFRVK